MHELEASYLWVPRAVAPVPLLVMLHGAGGLAEGALALVQDAAEASSVAVLAPQAGARTWDALLGGFGPDMLAIDRALDQVVRRLDVDPTRIALGGFSDGASYALSLGLGSGDVISSIAAFSPGFAAPDVPRGRPAIFVSHGTHDEVLPIGRCGRHVVSELRRAGYDVTYREFEGGHAVPPGIAREALRRIAHRAEERARP